MNILFLLGVYPNYGGVETVTTVLANAFVARGYQVSIVSFRQPVPELQKELDATIRLYKLKFPVLRVQNIRSMRNILKQRNIDVVISQWAWPWHVALFNRVAMSGLDCKLVTVHHGLPNINCHIKNAEQKLMAHSGNQILNRLRLIAAKACSRFSVTVSYKLAHRFVVLCNGNKEALISFINARNTDKLCVIPNPIDLKNEPEAKAKENVVVYVGRITYPEKCTYRLVDIWKHIEPRFPDWKLIIVGDGEDKGDLEARIKNADLKHVECVGFTNPFPYYNKAKITVLTSADEGFPIVLLEAMSQYVIPVVLDSFPACQDLIPTSQIGIRVPMPFNGEVFAEHLSRLMSDGDAMQQMSQNAFQHAHSFSLNAVLEQWQGLFNQLK